MGLRGNIVLGFFKLCEIGQNFFENFKFEKELSGNISGRANQGAGIKRVSRPRPEDGIS